MTRLSNLFARHGGEMPEGGFSAQEVWEANVMTRAEYARALEEERQARRAMAARAEETAAERERRELDAAMVAAGVPAGFLQVPVDARPLGALTSGRGLWLHGPKGTGKTFSACAALKAWVRSGRSGRFVGCVAMLAEIRDAMGDHREAQATASYARTPLLVLDDLGKEAPSPWVLSKIFAIVDERVSSGLPIVVTTQQGRQDLSARLARGGDPETAEAIVSRLSGSCDVVQTGGHDRRTHATC